MHPEVQPGESPLSASRGFDGTDSGIAGLTSLMENRNGAMDFRQERIAKNEAVVREINEAVQQTHESAPDSSFIHICECGYEKCDSHLFR
jgi:hypothetical protein